MLFTCPVLRCGTSCAGPLGLARIATRRNRAPSGRSVSPLRRPSRAGEDRNIAPTSQYVKQWPLRRPSRAGEDRNTGQHVDQVVDREGCAGPLGLARIATSTSSSCRCPRLHAAPALSGWRGSQPQHGCQVRQGAVRLRRPSRAGEDRNGYGSSSPPEAWAGLRRPSRAGEDRNRQAGGTDYLWGLRLRRPSRAGEDHNPCRPSAKPRKSVPLRRPSRAGEDRNGGQEVTVLSHGDAAPALSGWRGSQLRLSVGQRHRLEAAPALSGWRGSQPERTRPSNELARDGCAGPLGLARIATARAPCSAGSCRQRLRRPSRAGEDRNLA